MNIPLPRLCLTGLALLACSAPPVRADAPVLPPTVLARALALATEAAAALAPRSARVAALPGALDSRLNLAPCARIEPYLMPGVPAWGRTRVGLRCTDAGARWTVFLPVTVQVWAPAAVAGAPLPAGALLAESQVTLAEVDWGASNARLFTTAQALGGRTLARAVAAGQPLRASDLQPRLWFAAGERVRIVTSGAGFAISTDGVALAAGIDGQPVRVRTADDRVLVGRPVAERQVEVGL